MKEYDKMYFEKKAVVTYIINNNKLLLIEKKRGLGAGKINVPGGHIESGETPIEAAIRETREEVNLVISDLKHIGNLYFKFTNGLTMKGFVFITNTFEGLEEETDEANPFWCDLENIPYNKMWADDIIWIPKMIKGSYFRGYFEFDDDTLLNRKIQFYKSNEEFI